MSGTAITNEHFFAVIPAAGKGSRMGTDTGKQFIGLRGIPVLARTLLIFEGCAHIEGIVVVCGAQDTDKVVQLCTDHKISKILAVTGGGQTRQASVRNGLEKLADLLDTETAEASYVLIHDGARPFLSDRALDDCIASLRSYGPDGSCVCAVPVKDTVKRRGPDGFVTETVSREELWAVQTPQAFKLTDILAAHRSAADSGTEHTDDASVAESFGIKVRIISGDYTNIKITTREDLLFGEVITRNIKP